MHLLLSNLTLDYWNLTQINILDLLYKICTPGPSLNSGDSWNTKRRTSGAKWLGLIPVIPLKCVIAVAMCTVLTVALNLFSNVALVAMN